MIDRSAADGRIAELRLAFDRMYAVPPPSQVADQIENLLAIRVAGDAYAIRIREILGLTSGKKTVPLPSRIPELLGVAGIRGGFLPVYSLSALLGYTIDLHQGRWLVWCETEEPVGLTFSEFEGYVRIPLPEIYATKLENASHKHVTDVVRTGNVIRAIVSIPQIVEMIKGRCEKPRVSKER